MPISEIVDRYTIALLKYQKLGEDMEKEIKLYQDEMRSYPGIEHYQVKLFEINSRIWELEAALRSGKENELLLALVGETAIQIRNINRERVAVKNEIVEKYGEGFKDVKVNHCSE